MVIVEMMFTGSREECDAYVADQLRQYPAAGYGTWFNWPPGQHTNRAGKPLPYLEALDHGNDCWTVRGSRDSSA